MAGDLGRVVSKTGVSETKETTGVVSGANLIQRSKTLGTSETSSTSTVSKSKSVSTDVELGKDLSKIQTGSLSPTKSNAFVSFFKNLFGGGKTDFDDIGKIAQQQEKKLQEVGNLVVPKGQDDTSVKNPGIKCTLTKDVTIGTTTFKKGETCISYEKGGETFVQKVIPPKVGEKKSTLGEPLKLAQKELVKPTSEKFVKTDKPLFDSTPSIKDIKQGAIGDCYLIAGIYSMTNKDPQAIKNMIKDNGDGTVTVKLFDKVKGLDGENTFKEKFVTFEKSVVKGQGHAEDKLWVQMLEKAYAIHKGSYEAIGSGGHTNDVYEAFLGKTSSKLEIQAKSPTVKDDIVYGYPPYSVTPEKITTLKETLKGIDITDSKAEGGTRKLTTDELNKLDNIKFTTNRLDDVIKDLGLNLENPNELKGPIQKTFNNNTIIQGFHQLLDNLPAFKNLDNKKVQTQDDFDALIKDLRGKYKPDITIKVGAKEVNVHSIIDELETQKGKLLKKDTDMKTNYSEPQDKLFNTIKEELKTGHVSISTKEHIGISVGKGKSAGESMVDGLAGQHAYAVLDVVEMGGRKFVKIANPWGDDTSRDYKLKDGELVAKKFDKSDYSYLPKTQESRSGGGINANESWIDLKELGTIFDNLYVTK